jgi:hydrogenase maturation protein HypF
MGDLSNAATLAAFDRAIDHMCRLFRIAPEVLACDLHPGYLSTAWAQAHGAERSLIHVQHHHAHIAAVLAEHGVSRSADPVIGFAFDGTGYGMDGAIWGGEVLLADYRTFARAAHLRYIPLPGGDTAVKRPYRTALAHLWAAQASWDEGLPPVAACPPLERGVLLHQLTTGLNAPLTSSMGRLCDAVAALAGVRQVVDYEAQAAIALEALAAEEVGNCAGPRAGRAYEFGWEAGEGNGPIVLDAGPMVRAIIADVLAGVAAGSIAGRFHAALADLIVDLSVELRRRTEIGRVALSGGVFQNATLLRMAVDGLRKAGFDVLTHRRVPPNDGGLALGQAVVAAAQVLAPGENGIMGLSGQMSDAI